MYQGLIGSKGGVKGKGPVQSSVKNSLIQKVVAHTYITLRRPDLKYIIYDGCTLYWHAYDHAHSCIQPISKRLLAALIERIVALPEH